MRYDEPPFKRQPLGELVSITSGRLNTADAVKDGAYPFFTCAQEVQRIDRFEHDREAVLLGGNNANGVFPVFYYHGRFTARQRVYVLWSKDERVLSNRFLFYALKWLSPTFTPEALGTTTRFITLPMLKGLELPLPTRETQQAIVEILATLDERIALLNSENKTLESMAHTMFKSWFVDFDPVQAKSNGEQPIGMIADWESLFPCEFEDSELGPIPNGWVVAPLSRYIELVKGLSYKGGGLSDDSGAFMFNLGCFNSVRVFASANVKRYLGEYRTRHIVSEGDLIIANTDMTQARDILGRSLIVPPGFEPGFISHHVFRVVPKDDESWGSLRYFVFYALREPSFRERAVGFATGTTVLAMPVETVENHKVVMPSAACLDAFSELAKALFDKISHNETRVASLIEARDLLVPRLVSGQLRIPDAEKALEEAL